MLGLEDIPDLLDQFLVMLLVLVLVLSNHSWPFYQSEIQDENDEAH